MKDIIKCALLVYVEPITQLTVDFHCNHVRHAASGEMSMRSEQQMVEEALFSGINENSQPASVRPVEHA